MSKLKWKSVPDDAETRGIASVKLTKGVHYEVDVIEREDFVVWNVGVTLRDGTWMPVKQGKCKRVDQAKSQAEKYVLRMMSKIAEDLKKWELK